MDGRLASLALIHLFVAGFLSLSLASSLSPEGWMEAFAHWPASEGWVLDRYRVLLLRSAAWTGLWVVLLTAGILAGLAPASGSWPLGLLTAALQYALVCCLAIALVVRGGVWLVLVAVLAGVSYWALSLFVTGFRGHLVDAMNRCGGFLGHLLPTAWLLQPWIALREGERAEWWRWLPAMIAPWVAYQSWREIVGRYAFRERVLLDTYGEPPQEAGAEEVAAIEEARSRPPQPSRSEIGERIRSRAFLAEELWPMTGWLERLLWGRLTSRQRLLLEWRDAGLPDRTRVWWYSWAWLTGVFLVGAWLRLRGNPGLQGVVWVGGFLAVGTQFLPFGPSMTPLPLGFAPVLPREEWSLRVRLGSIRALCGLPQAFAFALAVGGLESGLGIARTTATALGWVLLSSQMPGLHWVNAFEGMRSGVGGLRRWVNSLGVLAGDGIFALCVVACGFTSWTWLALPVVTGILVSLLLQLWMLRRLERNRCDLFEG